MYFGTHEIAILRELAQTCCRLGTMGRFLEAYSFSTPIGFSVHEYTPENTQSGFKSLTEGSPALLPASKFSFGKLGCVC